MAAPIPRDPRGPRTTPEDVTRRIGEILAEPAGTLEAQADQLSRAHMVLSEALNDNLGK